MKRRNMDNDLRDAERAARAGDASAALRVYDLRLRAGAARELQSRPTFLVDAPGFGQLSITPVDEREVRVEFGRDVRIGSGEDYARQRVVLPPYVLRGVPHRGDVRFTYRDGAGFTVDVEGGSQRAWIHRTDQFHVEATKAAAAAILRALTPIVSTWAAGHRREMLDAEAISVNNDVVRAAEEVDKARQALSEAEGKLSNFMLRELAVEDAIRGL